MKTSTQRPIPLVRRADLVTRAITFQQSTCWVVKDPLALTYHQLAPEQFAVLEKLDGQRNLLQIQREVIRDFPACHLTLVDLQSLIANLHKLGLALSNRPGQGRSLRRQRFDTQVGKIIKAVTSLFWMRLPGWDADEFLGKMLPYVRWMFHPATGVVCSILVICAWLTVAVQFAEFRRRLPEFQQFFGWQNLFLLWASLACTKVLHEFGHGLSCKYFGSRCREMGVMLLVFSPSLYCDVTDSWLLPNRWHRIAIAAAGMIVEVVLSSIAIFVWWVTEPGLVHFISLNVFFVTTITTVIFNANPLMRYDGYYMLSDFLGNPNLRQKADRHLDRLVSWWCFGIRQPEDPFEPDRGRGWLAVYTVASTLYSWMVTGSILLFLYTWLKPYQLQSLGICLAALSVITIIGTMINRVTRMINSPRNRPLNPLRMTVSGLALASIISLILFVPIPWYIEASVLVEPLKVQHVYNPVPGVLKEVLVHPGEQVQAGDVLVRLSDFPAEDKVRQLKVDLQQQEKAIQTARTLEDHARLSEAEKRRSSVYSQLEEAEKQLAKLTIKAPIAGTVIAPPSQPTPPRDHANKQLPTWSGSPLKQYNLGATLDVRTHLLSLAPSDKMQAVMYLGQAHRNEVQTGSRVDLKLDPLPHQTFIGKLEEISHEHAEFVPVSLSNKSGGKLATMTDSSGRERLQEWTYQGTILLTEETALLRTGMRGAARVVVSRHTVAKWLWRTFRQTIHFRL